MNSLTVQLLALSSLFIGSLGAISSPTDYKLPSNATVINGGPIVTGFSCDGLPYGYYADGANDCKVFHICAPYVTPDDFTITLMYSFICGLGSVFNQEALVCSLPENSIPCQDSANYYSANNYFGKLNVNFRE